MRATPDRPLQALRRLPIRTRPDDTLAREIDAWERQRNATGARINRMFTTGKARTKMERAYPAPLKES